MPLDLDRLEQRIIGVLIEKQYTVPDTYPLTVNALVAGCNQKNNRDPQMDVEPYEVEGALRSLMDKSWVTQLDKEGGRTLRYAHRAEDQLGVGRAELALLSELLCRGPQAPGALKTRAGRMHPFPGPQGVEQVLRALAGRPVPYVKELARLPREHAARWMHLLGPADAPAGDVGEPEQAAPPRPVAPPPASPADPDVVAELLRRIELLEERLDRLEGR